MLPGRCHLGPNPIFVPQDTSGLGPNALRPSRSGHRGTNSNFPSGLVAPSSVPFVTAIVNYPRSVASVPMAPSVFNVPTCPAKAL